MRYLHATLQRRAWVFCLGAVLILAVISCGCTQQGNPLTPNASGLTVTKPDTSHITIAFTGAPGMDNLLELEITVTDSNGKPYTVSKGSRLATTPIQIHATQTFTGSFAGKNHVFITGYFGNGSHQVVYDQDI